MARLRPGPEAPTVEPPCVTASCSKPEQKKRRKQEENTNQQEGQPPAEITEEAERQAQKVLDTVLGTRILLISLFAGIRADKIALRTCLNKEVTIVRTLVAEKR